MSPESSVRISPDPYLKATSWTLSLGKKDTEKKERTEDNRMEGFLSLCFAIIFHRNPYFEARPHALIFDVRPQTPPAEMKLDPQLQFKIHTTKDHPKALFLRLDPRPSDQ